MLPRIGWCAALMPLVLGASVLPESAQAARSAVRGAAGARYGRGVTAAENAHWVGAPRAEWDVNGAGSTLIQGFATEQSVLPGETVEFKVNSTLPYAIRIYRLVGLGPMPGGRPLYGSRV